MLVHLLVASAAKIGCIWTVSELGWARPGLRPLRLQANADQHFLKLLGAGWRNKVASDLSRGACFRGGPFLDLDARSPNKRSDLEWFPVWPTSG